MGRPFSVEHIVLSGGAEDPRFEPRAMLEEEFFGSLHDVNIEFGTLLYQ